MAIHSGEAEERDGDYFGRTVNRVSHIRDAAHGGQILVSAAVAELTKSVLPAGVTLKSLGEHRLRDLERPEHIFQVVHRELRAGFPPLRTLSVLANNLPRMATSFIGRTREIDDVKRLLSESALVTLTGVGGTGKTRLALQVGAEFLTTDGRSVWFAELSGLADEALVPHSVASALRLREDPKRPIIDTLTDYLRPMSALVILDNCEHLLHACALLADTLLKSCPQARILATSREPLQVPGEVIYRVPSLSFEPAAIEGGPAMHEERRMPSEAVRLFVERAMAANPGFAGNGPTIGVVEEICRRLDGIPLAIELAAARVRVLTPEQVRDRLSDRFQLLTGGSRTARERHQTLRATVDWSYDSLTDEERRALRALSVFAGGFTLETAEALCEGDVLNTISHLVDKSLVNFDPVPTPRYRLLEIIREYAGEKLGECGEERGARDRHLKCFAQLTEQAEPHLTSVKQKEWLDLLEREHENLRSALEWGLGGRVADEGRETNGSESDDPNARLVLALRLAAAPGSRFWEFRAHFSEGRRYLKAATEALAGLTNGEPAGALTAKVSGALLGKLWHCAGALAHRQADYAESQRDLERACRFSEDAGDRRGLAHALNGLGIVAKETGNFERAHALYESALRIWRELGDPWGVAMSLNNLGVVAKETGNLDDARTLYEEAIEMWRTLGDQWSISMTMNNLGVIARAQGDTRRATELYEEALRIRREIGDRRGIAMSLGNLGNVRYQSGEYEHAEALYDEALKLRQEVGDRFGVAVARLNLGNIAVATGDYETAESRYREVYRVVTEIGDRLVTGYSLYGLGMTALRQGKNEEALSQFTECLSIWRDIGHKTGLPDVLDAFALSYARTAAEATRTAAHPSEEGESVQPLAVLSANLLGAVTAD
jgi:predicted ATPase/Tfp pilus assembly protein PilF